MKGIVFNLLEEIVRREHGDEVWDALLTEADLDGAYTSLGSYPDDHLSGLVGAASRALGLPPDAVVHWFGRNALALLAERYPGFFDPYDATRPFLLTLNDIIHPEVRKLYPGADVPDFDFDASSEETLVMAYRSRRKLCSFALGLIEGAAAHYGERVALEHPQCQVRGDEKCLYRLSFSKAEA